MLSTSIATASQSAIESIIGPAHVMVGVLRAVLFAPETRGWFVGILLRPAALFDDSRQKVGLVTRGTSRI